MLLCGSYRRTVVVEHKIGYIIESDDDVRIEYVREEYEPYFQPEWVNGVNSFSNTDDVDPNSVDSPDLIRVSEDSGYGYYSKTLILPWKTANFRILVVIDGVEGNNSFVYEGYNTFIKTRRDSSKIYATVKDNRSHSNRSGAIRITHSSDANSSATLKILQDECDIRIGMLSCVVNGGEEIPISPNLFEYEFDTLTGISDGKKEFIKIKVLATGVTNKFYIKSIKEYVAIGEIDNTYKYIDGKFYKSMLKWSNGNYVTYRAEALVIDNIGYQPKKYDNAFDIKMGTDSTITITNYGRVFMEPNATYIITLANYDDIDVTCEIRLVYKENPLNLL